MSNLVGSFTKLPEGWRKCAGVKYNLNGAKRFAELWNARNDGYFYKIFPKFNDRDTTYIIARRLKSEIE